MLYYLYEASRNHSYWKERSAEKKGVALWQGKTIKVEIFIQVNHSAMTESICYRYMDIRSGKRQTIYAGDLAELRAKEKQLAKDLDDNILIDGSAKK